MRRPSEGPFSLSRRNGTIIRWWRITAATAAPNRSAGNRPFTPSVHIMDCVLLWTSRWERWRRLCGRQGLKTAPECSTARTMEIPWETMGFILNPPCTRAVWESPWSWRDPIYRQESGGIPLSLWQMCIPRYWRVWESRRMRRTKIFREAHCWLMPGGRRKRGRLSRNIIPRESTQPCLCWERDLINMFTLWERGLSFLTWKEILWRRRIWQKIRSMRPCWSGCMRNWKKSRMWSVWK